MIPANFDYARAKSLREVLNTLATGSDTKLIAGGHSLIPLLRFRLAQPAKLLDIGGLPELKGIEAKGRGLKIGAGTTYRDVLDSALVQERCPLLTEAVHTIADLQVRNRGTVGGGLAHADPASDLPAVMLALGASFLLRSKAGKRTVEARDFFTGAFTTAMREDELLTDILIPPLPKGAGTAYVSFEQKASGYALAAAAAVVTRKRNTITSVTVALTGVADRAFIPASIASLVNGPTDPAALDEAASHVTDGIEVNGDIHASAEYRRHLAHVATRRALELALHRT